MLTCITTELVAEKTLLQLRRLANDPKYKDRVIFFAVSHSDEKATQNWPRDVEKEEKTRKGQKTETDGTMMNGNGEGDNTNIGIDSSSDVRIVVDQERELYATWGLGPSSIAHVLRPTALWGAVKLAREEGISMRDTESGSRWQTAGGFAVDGEGIVRWARVAERADDIVDFEAAAEAVLKGHDGKSGLN